MRTPLQAQVETLVVRYKDGARRLAARAAEIGLLNDNKASNAPLYRQSALNLPQVLKLRLLRPARATSTRAASGIELRVSRLLDRSEKGQTIRMPSCTCRHAVRAHRRFGAGHRPADSNSARSCAPSLDPAMLRHRIGGTETSDGYAELRQVTPRRALVIANGGDAGLKSGVRRCQNITGTNWQLAYWPAITPGHLR